MGWSNHEVRNPPCPVCKSSSAFMGKSVWAPFNGLACSDECGEAAKAALTALHSTDRYMRLENRIWNARHTMSELESKAIAAAAPPTKEQ